MFYELANLSIHNLLRARARLAMTAGGVMIGTAAIVLLIALTNGLQAAAESEIGDDASLTQITIRSGFRRDDSSPTLDMDAVTELANLDGVGAVIPLLSLDGQAELIYDDLTGSAQVYGVYPATLPYLGVDAETGTLALDNSSPYAAVIGASVATSFADDDGNYVTSGLNLMSDPIQMRVYVRGATGRSTRKVNITINGILEDGSSQDFALYLPIDTVIDLNERLAGAQIDTEDLVFDQILVQAADRDSAGTLIETITNLGYNATGMGSYLSQISSFFGIMRLMLGGVGAVALLVAAFGVANTMTMAILERTREIGLMKAVGASDQAVMTVFLLEAGTVGLLGGLVGLGLSYGLQSLINSLLTGASSGGSAVSILSLDISLGSSLIEISGDLAVFALALATTMGVSAGILPALRAARMLPVLALKTE
jgi:putative ABC transport system permease protein